MRFNDMIATVLAATADRPEAREAQWRQLVDLLAQRQPGAADAARAEAYAFLRDNRSAVEPRIRAAAASSLAGLAIDPDLLAFFAQDRAEVSAPLLRATRLHRDDWLALLPRLGPTARALLRHRRDLPEEVRRALAAFGPSDLVLERQEAAPELSEAAQPAESGSPILELVERIEAFQRQRQEPSLVSVALAVAPEAIADAAFRWETGSEGVIRWVDDGPRGALVGASIAAADHDEAAATAFGRREPFRDARLSVADGDWQISGVPFFDAARGSFLGYRGSARRSTNATAKALQRGPFGADLQPDALRQLIHELRTPINAIMGFAELIEGQFMGPAADRYRTRAADIMDQAGRLLATVDDLDTAARIETDRLGETGGRADVAALLEALGATYGNVAHQRGARLAIDVAAGVTDAAVAPDVAEKLFGRLLATTIGLVREGESFAAELASEQRDGREMLVFAIDRPGAVMGQSEQALLDPRFMPAGEWPSAPALGLGFALRLVRNLAEAAGGGLVIGEHRIRLLLPAAL